MSGKLEMNYEEFKLKLVQPNSGSEAFNSGVKQANSRAKKLIKKLYEDTDFLINETKRIQKDNARLRVLFDDEFCRCSKCGEYKRKGFGCYCGDEGE